MESAWIILVCVGALFIRVGQCLYASGLSRSKNAASAIFRLVCDLCISSLAYWAIGASIVQYAGNPIFGIDPRLLFGWHTVTSDFGGGPGLTFTHLTILLIGTALVPMAMGERTRFAPLCVVSLVLAAVILPVVGYWAWRGWLGRMGFIDGVGASYIHLAGAICAAVGCAVVGPRTGKYNRDGSANMIPGHSLPLASVGVLVMLVGWLPHASLAPGGLATIGALNVLLAASAGGVVSLIFSNLRYGKPDVMLFYSGVLGGLVAISAGAPLVHTIGAVIIGAIAGLLVPLAMIVLDTRWHLDDPAGVVAIHGVGGITGTLLVGLCAAGDVSSRLKQLGVQALGVVAIGVFVLIFSFIFFRILRTIFVLRSKEADEYDGLDLAEHDLNAYPDFHQTMIKSYHLREA